MKPNVQFRNYTTQAGITEDYFKVRAFLIELGNAEFTYVRWDWMTTHGYLDKSAVGKIGIWEVNENVVGVATFDCGLGQAFCLTLPQYSYLKEEMLIYSQEHLAKECEFTVAIADTDIDFQDMAANLGYVATEQKECDAVFYTDKTSLDYTLPQGFKVTSMAETYDAYQYQRVLWKGFNHEVNGEGKFQFSKEKEQDVENEMRRPNVDLNLKIAVVAPDGNFVSYCGLWYDPQAGYAVIEPLATDPDYRKMGLGKAAVLEGIKRVSQLGATKVFVGSSQQFYYSIGMRPYATATLWKKRNK